MVFQDGGDSSLTLQFLLFCNGTVSSIVDNEVDDIIQMNGEEGAPTLQYTTTEDNRPNRGNIGTETFFTF